MKSMRLAEDILPIGEFKAQASSVIRNLQESNRAIVITQNGRPAAVLITPQEFDRLSEQQRFLAAIDQGWAESEAGLGIDDDELDLKLNEMFVRPEP
ncbi:MAG TPA: type II toxin-antitoxin system Phd/YefM family antitoxin [Thermoanaerobaculia bacterium]|jgi:prevent-host-death family protein